jgi:CopG family transcriptional regulator, nickel-responsive regulator
MPDLVRLSFSIDHGLAESFEDLVRTSACNNRSEFFRDMIRDLMVAREWRDAGDGAEAVGTITLVYDHHARGLDEKLTDLQHDHHDMVLATTHVHLDHHLCAEVIICRGRPLEIRSMCDRLRQQKGVLHGALTMSSTGRRLAGERGEG